MGLAEQSPILHVYSRRDFGALLGMKRGNLCPEMMPSMACHIQPPRGGSSIWPQPEPGREGVPGRFMDLGQAVDDIESEQEWLS